jgi:indole-3-glycerol phosphate synthase
MPASLASIIDATRRSLSLRKNGDQRALERMAAGHAPRGFRKRLEQAAAAGEIAVIAELKKASPSRGLIRTDFRPFELARDLEKAGAAALSILTDEPFFQGSLEYLREASTATSLPCLRKDFIVDKFQIVEARANRADAVLLIVAALEQRELAALAAGARMYGMDVLCEAHDEDELNRALDAGCDLIGINSRNLHTFEVDLRTAFRLVEKIPEACVAVAESGIHSGADLGQLRAAGYDAFLIGESLMKEARPGEALASLLDAARAEARPEC